MNLVSIPEVKWREIIDDQYTAAFDVNAAPTARVYRAAWIMPEAVLYAVDCKPVIADYGLYMELWVQQQMLVGSPSYGAWSFNMPVWVSPGAHVQLLLKHRIQPSIPRVALKVRLVGLERQ